MTLDNSLFLFSPFPLYTSSPSLSLNSSSPPFLLPSPSLPSPLLPLPSPPFSSLPSPLLPSPGPDGSSARMLRETAEHISPSLKKYLIHPSSLDHFLHSGKRRMLFQCQKPMITVIHLTTGPYLLIHLSWANYWRNMFTTYIIAKHISTNPQFGNVQYGFQCGKLVYHNSLCSNNIRLFSNVGIWKRDVCVFV